MSTSSGPSWKRSSPPSLNLPPPPPLPPLMEAEQFRRHSWQRCREAMDFHYTTDSHTILADFTVLLHHHVAGKKIVFVEFCFIYTALFGGPFLYAVLFVLVLNDDWRLEKAFSNRVDEWSTFTTGFIWDLFNRKKKKKCLNTNIFIIHFVASSH